MLVAAILLGQRPAAAGPEGAYYASDSEGVFWFVHVSDIHIGAGWPEPSYGVANLGRLLGEVVATIQPAFVVATGDLTDGSANGTPISGQDQGEWDQYKGIYTGAGMSGDTYYDVIGNHDLYGDDADTIRYYLNNSLQGQLRQEAHFGWSYTTSLGEYYFYAFNCMGTRLAPFTMGVGAIPQGDLDALQEALDQHQGARLRLAFAHQGLGTPSNGGLAEDMLASAQAHFFHGHWHVYSDYLVGAGQVVVNQVNSLGQAQRNNVGVAAIDHDAVVYRATSIEQPWPFVVITAPMAHTLRSGSLHPWAYDVCAGRPNNPVRALVFNPTAPTSVDVRVGGLGPWPLTPLAAPAGLYAGTMDTSSLAPGVYDVMVTAVAGSATASDTVAVNFVAGPCADLPGPDGGLPGDDAGAGADAAADGDLPDAGGEAGDRGLAEAAVTDGGAEPAAGNPSDGGCGCRTTGPRGRVALPPLLLALAFLLRHRRTRSRSS